jgi:hypothetical protein
MLKVITDTLPIQYLYQISQLDLLPALYGMVRMPQAVADELNQGRIQGIPLPDPISLSWISICPEVPSMLIPDTPNLGAGEHAAISLAMNTPDSLVILDDGLARSYARQLSIAMTGTLGYF